MTQKSNKDKGMSKTAWKHRNTYSKISHNMINRLIGANFSTILVAFGGRRKQVNQE